MTAFSAAAFFCVVDGSAFAHSLSDGGSHAWLNIPQISPGEMAVMSDYRGRIIDLASRAVDTNGLSSSVTLPGIRPHR
ncbi:hypothetical protein AB9F38_36370, partial [Rhizobium leguminosarum]